MRTLRSTKRFEREVRRLPDQLIDELDEVTRLLTEDPEHELLGVKQLEDVPGNLYRVAVGGEYRLIFAFTKTTVLLHHIGHRGDVYETL